MKQNRSRTINIRLTDDELVTLKRNCEKCRLSLSEYTRQCVIGYTPKEFPQDVFYEFMNKLDDIVENNNSPMSDEKIVELLEDINETINSPIERGL